VWYEIHAQVNNREPLFRFSRAPALFGRVFREAQLRFVFTARALRLEDEWLTFYIKPEDGMELPVIMKWIKQTFAQRYNRMTGRIGHVWGDRYWSAILEGEPGEGGAAQAAATRVRPQGGNEARKPGFSQKSPPSAPFSPG
jgi:hypothetical protein